MYLPRTSCIICGEHIAKIKYNLKTTYSEKSNALLIRLVEKFYKNISLLHCNICSGCYELLNELDTVQQREKELYAQLKDHISKLRDTKSVNIDNMSDLSFPFDTLSTDYPEQDIIPDFVDNEEEIQIADIDLKKLPIKVKRIRTSKPRPDIDTKEDVTDKEKAFEQIQSTIQMDLSKHIEEHMNKCKPSKNVLCEVCGQNFKTKSGYGNHLKKHDDIEDKVRLLALNKLDDLWFCNICGKNFNQKVALARHLVIHTGETRYQCEECGKKFLHHSSFNMHKKIHAGQRNFKCEMCHHCFLTNSHLKRHIRATHEKEKKYACETCGKKFAENYNLIAHIKIVHKGVDVNEAKEEKKVFYQVPEGTIIHMGESPSTVLYNL